MTAVTSRDALCSFFEARGIKPRDESFEEWFRHDWARIAIFGRRVPVKPIYGLKRTLVLHDLHHLLTGYDTSWTGELEVAAWELGSGGCGSHFLFWYNRILYTLLVWWLAPRRAAALASRARPPDRAVPGSPGAIGERPGVGRPLRRPP